MNNHKTREDDYKERRQHLENLSDAQLKQRFWDLADQATSPLIDLAYSHTSPAIERSVLLRMGFSSIEAAALVKLVLAHNLIGKGAGHVVYRYANIKQISIRESGLELIQGKGFEDVIKSFEVTK
ncbi:MAG: ornithine aminomutase subunit alpha [Bacilli bacterium]|nr:ornithine aminomutase subunit alpha [Bacilli bacterium]MBN2877730.1 ornithine aminomutase subunit alpha [Bacilli bacterium]